MSTTLPTHSSANSDVILMKVPYFYLTCPLPYVSTLLACYSTRAFQRYKPCWFAGRGSDISISTDIITFWIRLGEKCRCQVGKVICALMRVTHLVA